jgi:Kef-type K+ transport system membrane component KefB
MTNFFITLFTFLVIPILLSRLLGTSKLLPLVFLQLMFGVFLNASGITAELKAHDIDLLRGTLPGALQGLGWLGVALLVTITGGEVMPETGQGRRAQWRVGVISVCGFATTCAIGGLIGYGLAQSHPELMGPRTPAWVFAMAIGLALAVTALPVLVVIVRQGGYSDVPVAKLAMHCAMLDDLWLWLGMAVVLACASSTAASPLWLAGSLLCYLVFMFGLIRPALRKWYAHPGRGEVDGLMVAIATILMSAALTGLIGLHSIFGSFIAGVILPRAALKNWREPMQQLIHVLLLPAFFILTGMRLNIDLQSPLFWQLTAVVTAGAILGKMLSVAVSARLTGLPWKTGLVLGGLMQCKGLMELIAINILLDAGIIGKELFSALAMMAMVSTFVTLPLTRLLLNPGRGQVGMAVPRATAP